MFEKSQLTDQDVEKEIKRLNASDEVAIARKEQRLQYKRRQRLYNLRSLEKHGKELIESGMTIELLNKISGEFEEVEE